MSQPHEPLFDTLTVVGVGLLGGSVALAAKQRNIARHVIGVGRNAKRLREAQAAGIVDEFETDLRAAAARSQLLIFALPVDCIVASVRDAAVGCRSGTMLTDVGSTKSQIARELSSALPVGVTFIGSHPLAGSEKAGWEHARGDLFDGRVCVVTPVESSPSEEISRLTEFWSALGLTMMSMTPEAHDHAVAQTSHVPHVVASALARTLADENRSLAASGFADTTRIAAGDSDVWIPILLQNADEVIRGVDAFADQVAAFREALIRRDVSALAELWARGQEIREQCGARGSRAPE